MELPGPWVATEADDEIRRNGIALELEDTSGGGPRSRCLAIGRAPPSSPRATARSCTGTIHGADPEDGRRRWVTLDGIFYQADVWLDGAYLGDPEGYFFPHSFDITDLSRFDEAHVLAVEVTCAPQGDPRSRPQHHRGVATVGVVRPVVQPGRPVASRPALRHRACAHRPSAGVVSRCRRPPGPCATDRPARQRHAAAGRDPHDDRRPSAHRGDAVVATGQNDLEWSIDITDPALWWPAAR